MATPAVELGGLVIAMIWEGYAWYLRTNAYGGELVAMREGMLLWCIAYDGEE